MTMSTHHTNPEQRGLNAAVKFTGFDMSNESGPSSAQRNVEPGGRHLLQMGASPVGMTNESTRLLPSRQCTPSAWPLLDQRSTSDDGNRRDHSKVSLNTFGGTLHPMANGFEKDRLVLNERPDSRTPGAVEPNGLNDVFRKVLPKNDVLHGRTSEMAGVLNAQPSRISRTLGGGGQDKIRLWDSCLDEFCPEQATRNHGPLLRKHDQ